MPPALTLQGACLCHSGRWRRNCGADVVPLAVVWRTTVRAACSRLSLLVAAYRRRASALPLLALLCDRLIIPIRVRGVRTADR